MTAWHDKRGILHRVPQRDYILKAWVLSHERVRLVIGSWKTTYDTGIEFTCLGSRVVVEVRPGAGIDFIASDWA